MYCLSIMGLVISDYNQRLILLSMIQLSGGHCIKDEVIKNRYFCVKSNLFKKNASV